MHPFQLVAPKVMGCSTVTFFSSIDTLQVPPNAVLLFPQVSAGARWEVSSAGFVAAIIANLLGLLYPKVE
jgi:hypothetical protein